MRYPTVPITSSRRSFLTLSITGAMALTLRGTTVAATPVAFELPELPELQVTITDDAFDAPEHIAAGRYLLTVTNQSSSDAAADFILPPSELSLEEVANGLAAIPRTAANAHGTPAAHAPGGWFYSYDIRAAGGGDAAAGATRRAVIDLEPGRWVIWSDDFSNTTRIAELQVTGEMPANLPTISPSVTVTQDDTKTGFVFVVPDTLPSGPHIVQVTNESSQPHVAIFMKLPRQLSTADVMSIFGLPVDATPIPGLPGLDELEFALGAPIITSGVTQWQLHDFAPGYYAVICRIPDPIRGGVPHAAEGMLQIIEVH
jgi:hypothetical protein